MTQRLENCTFSKVVLMLLVIMYHATVFWKGNWFAVIQPKQTSYLLSDFSSWLNSFHIYAFTLISGYIFAHKRLQGDYCQYSSFLRNKAKRLLIPYAFVAVVWLIPVAQFFYRYTAKELFSKYVLCYNPNQCWFLWMLFIVFCIAWPYWNITQNRKLEGYIGAVILYVIGYGGRYLSNIFCVFLGLQYFIFFYLGMQIRIMEESGKQPIIDKVPSYVWIIMDVLLFALRITISNPVLEQLIIFLLHIVGAIMSFKVLDDIGSRFNWEENKVFSKLSKITMPIFLFHQQFIYMSLYVFNGLVNPYINVLINFALSLCASYVISSILMRWRYTRFLVGEK